MERFKVFVVCFMEYFLNYIVAYIPFWHIRYFFYLLSGMKIGRKTRILMGTSVREPWKIEIGNGCVINERCLLDGRGRLHIGNNVSLSIDTVILTGTHITNSVKFDYISIPVAIEDNVWTGARTTILPGVVLNQGVVLAAGSVASKGVYEKCGIFSGIPAVQVGYRKLEQFYELGKWKPWFR